MLNWHKNKGFTGELKYFLSQCEVLLYSTELLRKNPGQGCADCAKERGTNRKWHHSFCSLTLGDKGMKLQKKRGKRERDRKWMGWMEGTKEWGDLEQSCPAGQITGNLLLTAESVSSVSAGSSNHHELRIFTWTLTTATISILRTRNSIWTVD